MTNYNERLDEILAKHNGELGVTWEDTDIVTPDTKQAITSLIKELVAEAKPEKATISDDEMGIDRARKSAANHAIDQFEQNLLKSFEDKK